ncbi:hypothetical protein CEXT_155471 [Caerostris extrusa]|uniref:Uncharacterized protein n=1 Tax=Caerostris extrusa TaxID=172846 RepID=A0AAV4X8R4_CAEEX|nr:hypothetical protein CEXT_155471 [Caerostris extrusa]
MSEATGNTTPISKSEDISYFVVAPKPFYMKGICDRLSWRKEWTSLTDLLKRMCMTISSFSGLDPECLCTLFFARRNPSASTYLPILIWEWSM